MSGLPGAPGSGSQTPLTVGAANLITGGLSKPSKMPGHAYGLPAAECKVGAALQKIPNSVCANCYALKGMYRFRNVQDAQYRRLQAIQHPRWIEAMVFLIKRLKVPFFRWHDSGDLQGLWHLKAIVEVAEQLPDVKFWLPTREKVFVHSYLRQVKPSFPPNLTVRVSAALVDGPAPVGFPNTSTVVSSSPTCPAPKQNNECGTCRACWDPTVQNVSYQEH